MSTTFVHATAGLLELLENLIILFQVQQELALDNSDIDYSANDWLSSKAQRIENCLDKEPIDLWELRELALSKGGLLKSQYRQQVWPLLVGLAKTTEAASESEQEAEEDYNSEKDVEKESEEESEKNEEQSFGPPSPTSIMDFFFLDTEVLESFEKGPKSLQTKLIRRDANRSVIFQYNKQAASSPCPDDFASKRLASVLEEMIRQDPSLHYYQGLHDITGVLLHNMEYQRKQTSEIAKQLCKSHLRDAMRENFGDVIWLLNLFLMPLVERVDPHVHYALQELQTANFVLPWIITWFTHDIYNPVIAGRLADAFLAGHPLLPMYFAIALLTHPVLKETFLQADSDDMATLFVTLKALPKSIDSDLLTPSQRQQFQHKVPVQELLEDSLTIMRRFSPVDLLDLLDPDMYPREELLERISSISAFKMPSSWSISEGKVLPSAVRLQPGNIRAKLASGIPILMNSVNDNNASYVTSWTWGSRRYQLRRRKTKWQRLKRGLIRMKRKMLANT